MEEISERKGGETVVRFKLWGVIALIIAGLSYLLVCTASLDKRMTAIETSLPYISENISDVKTMVKEIRADQVRRAKE